jgi:photosynthetic reaction center H subunit
MTNPLKLRPVDGIIGSALVPTGDPMLDGVGPAAWANRHDEPDRTVYGEPKIVPMRFYPGYSINPRDPNPIGLPVEAADRVIAGHVVDVWVDRSEPQVRYYEVRLLNSEERRLLPAPFVQWPKFGLFKSKCDRLLVKSITAAHFRNVPQAKSDRQVTLLEEDKIMAYYGGGHLYALPGRDEGFLQAYPFRGAYEPDRP